MSKASRHVGASNPQAASIQSGHKGIPDTRLTRNAESANPPPPSTSLIQCLCKGPHPGSGCGGSVAAAAQSFATRKPSDRDVTSGKSFKKRKEEKGKTLEQGE